jgi:hypothetical protein
MTRTRARRRAAAIGLSVAVSAALTGCSWPDVSMSPGIVAEDAPASAPAGRDATDTDPGTELVSDATPARPAGDLDTGSTTRTVPAGDRALVVDWWTTEPARQWRAADTKGLQLSAHLEGGDPDLEVLVTRFVATADDGTTRSTVAEDRGEFALQPPYSYGTALVLTPSAADAGQVDLSVQFDLLVETEPGSRRYFRQTVLDSIVLPFLQEETQ